MCEYHQLCMAAADAGALGWWTAVASLDNITSGACSSVKSFARRGRSCAPVVLHVAAQRKGVVALPVALARHLRDHRLGHLRANLALRSAPNASLRWHAGAALGDLKARIVAVATLVDQSSVVNERGAAESIGTGAVPRRCSWAAGSAG